MMDEKMNNRLKKIVATDVDFEMGIIDIAVAIRELFVECPDLSKVLFDFKNGQIVMVED